MVASKEDIDKLTGFWGDTVNPVGTAKFTAPAGFCFLACNCRVDGSKIASVEKSVLGVVSAGTDTYIGIAMTQGEYHVFGKNIVSVTLTNSIDQLQLWLTPLS